MNVGFAVSMILSLRMKARAKGPIDVAIQGLFALKWATETSPVASSSSSAALGHDHKKDGVP